MKHRAVPHTHSAHRVAVIARREGEKNRSLSLPALLPRLMDHFYTSLHRCASVVGKKDTPSLRLIAPCERLQQLACKFRRDIIRESEKRSMRHTPELRANRIIEFCATMTVEIRPNRRIPIEIHTPLRIAQQRAFAFHDHHRIARIPRTHLRERVPDVSAIMLLGITHGYETCGAGGGVSSMQ